MDIKYTEGNNKSGWGSLIIKDYCFSYMSVPVIKISEMDLGNFIANF